MTNLKRLDRWLVSLFPDKAEPLRGRWWVGLGMIAGYYLGGL